MNEIENIGKITEDLESTIISLEKQALKRWNDGDPDGFLELSAENVIYSDPALENKLLGRKALRVYYESVRGNIRVDRYEMINPVVILSSDIAILNYIYEASRDGELFRMHCREIYRRGTDGRWEIVDTLWSFLPPAK